MQAQGRKTKDYLIITVDIQSFFSDYNFFLLLTILWKKKKEDYLTGYFHDKIMAAYSNIVIS